VAELDTDAQKLTLPDDDGKRVCEGEGETLNESVGERLCVSDGVKLDVTVWQRDTV
jgi:hypothetical protein